MIKSLTMGTMDLGLITNAPVGSFECLHGVRPAVHFPERRGSPQVLDGESGQMLLSRLENFQIVGLAYSEKASAI
jgi:hypothetical protein